MIDDADYTYQVYEHWTVRRARKEHRCFECYRTIRAGESYESYSCGPRDGGGWDYFKTCAHCQIACQWLTLVCHGFLHGVAQEDIEEHASAYKRMDLYRLTIGMRRKWTCRNGQLMNIPRLPSER